MSKLGTGIVAIFLAAVMSVAVQAAPRGGGGHGGGGHGGGGGGHAAMRGGGGGGAHFGGGGRGGMHFNAARGGARFSGRSAAPRSFSRSRGNVARSHVRGNNRSLAGRNGRNGAAGRAARFNSNPNGRNASRNATNNARVNNSRLTGNARTTRVRNALNSPRVRNGLRNHNALRNPHMRNRVLAGAALAGRGGRGWWRHRGGGYGWVGPVFWPFAYYDLYNYAFWGGYDDSFWGYGYDDIYAGVFSPYGYDDYAGYIPPRGATATTGLAESQPNPGPNTSSAPAQLAQMCGEDSNEIAGLPISQFRQAIQPNDEQQAALDDLAQASAKASRDIKAACPTQAGLTAPDRIAAMQTRIEAMISAVDTVQPPLEKFYGTLNDEQKARLTALRNGQRQGGTANAGDSLTQSCNAEQVTAWPTAEIDRTVHPTEAQRDGLTALQNAAAKASDMLKTSCPTGTPLTPPARLAAVGERLNTMLQAVKTVRGPLDEFYAQLNDEQKAQFEAIGPERTASTSPADDASNDRPVRRRHVRGHNNIGSILRRFGI